MGRELLKSIPTLIHSTFEKEIRSKMFWAIAVFTALALWIFKIIHQEGVMLSVSMFFYLVLFWSSLLAAIFSVGLIRSDEEEGTLKQLLAFPLSRAEYLVGRLLGGLGLVFFYHFLSIMLSGVWLFGTTVSFKACLLLSFLVIPSLLVTMVQGMILSLFFNRIVSLLFILFWGGLETWAVAVMGEGMFWGDMSGIDFLFFGVYWLFPHGDWWMEQALALLASPDKTLQANWFLESGHFGLSFALLVTILVLIFRRRDI